MSKPFDPTKQVQTVDGRAARVICTDVVGGGIVYLVTNFDPVNECVYESTHTCEMDGEPHGGGTAQLINVPVSRAGFVNIYREEDSGEFTCSTETYETREKAEQNADLSGEWVQHIGTVLVCWEE